MAPSSSGLGCHPLKVETRVRIPLGLQRKTIRTASRDSPRWLRQLTLVLDGTRRYGRAFGAGHARERLTPDREVARRATNVWSGLRPRVRCGLRPRVRCGPDEDVFATTEMKVIAGSVLECQPSRRCPRVPRWVRSSRLSAVEARSLTALA